MRQGPIAVRGSCLSRTAFSGAAVCNIEACHQKQIHDLQGSVLTVDGHGPAVGGVGEHFGVFDGQGLAVANADDEPMEGPRLMELGDLFRSHVNGAL